MCNGFIMNRQLCSKCVCNYFLKDWTLRETLLSLDQTEEDCLVSTLFYLLQVATTLLQLASSRCSTLFYFYLKISQNSQENT